MIDTSKFDGHTPGPWIPDWSMIRNAATGIEAYRGGEYWKCKSADQQKTWECTIAANQSLIAAAPELLKENQRLRSAIHETLAENRHLADGENCTLRRLVKAIRRKEQ